MVTMVAAKMYNDAASSWNEIAAKAKEADPTDLAHDSYVHMTKELSGDLVAFLKGILRTEEDFQSVCLKNGEFPMKKDPNTDEVVEFVLFDISRLPPIV